MIKKVVAQVKGMSCAACALTVKKAIENTKGVVNANVNLATNQATFSYDTSLVSIDEIFRNVEKTGYSLNFSVNEESNELKSARLRLVFSLVFLIPLVFIMINSMLGKMIPFMDIWDLILSGSIIFIIGYPVQYRAFKALFHGNFNMDFLIALGSIASYSTGLMNIFGLQISDFSYVGGMIMFFHLLGKYLETLAKGQATQAIKGLLEQSAKSARIIVDNKEVEVPISKLDVGDIMIIRPGEKIPTDGVIVEGITTVDESMVTGESLPVTKEIGNEVIGETINQYGTIKVQVAKVGENTFLSQLIKLVYEAQGSKVPIQEFADKVITYFVPAVLIISLLTFIFWFSFPELGKSILLWGDKFIPWINPNLDRISEALFASVATLVIACPCALGLATPTALLVGSGLGARNGILIKNGKVIQTIKDVDTIVFDKTGTLTTGKPEVSDVFDFTEDNSGLKILSSLEILSLHPIAKAITQLGEKKGITPLPVSDFITTPGIGVKGKIDNHEYFAEKPFPNFKVKNDNLANIYEIINKLESDGKTVVVLFDNESILCVVGVGDKIKDEAKEVIDTIKSYGITPIMLTGDNERTANAIAKEIGIDIVKAGVLPKDKLDFIKSLQEEGHIVAFVGDGINDTPSIKGANVGIAMGSGSDIAISAGDIVIVGGRLQSIIKAINLSKSIFKKIKENLFWALFYNLIAIPIAGAGFLHPVIAEIAMALSSINVITNSLRLNKLKL